MMVVGVMYVTQRKETLGFVAQPNLRVESVALIV
jgi:hypothetical protein